MDTHRGTQREGSSTHQEVSSHQERNQRHLGGGCPAPDRKSASVVSAAGLWCLVQLPWEAEMLCRDPTSNKIWGQGLNMRILGSTSGSDSVHVCACV